MARFDWQEEQTISEITQKELAKHYPEAGNKIVNVSIVWRQDPFFVTVIWVSKSINDEEYEQFNYHFLFKVIYKGNGRHLRMLETHEGASNTWIGSFKCRSCIYVAQVSARGKKLSLPSLVNQPGRRMRPAGGQP